VKVHLKATDEPLKSGKDHVALCGAIVKRAEFPMIWDADIIGHRTFALAGFCMKCREKDFNGRYVYGLIPGEEAKQHDPSV